jgi:hypothetical protein
MKRIVFAVTLIVALTGCRAPSRIRSALEVQALYTRVYIEATLPLLRSSDHPRREELEGIGTRLIRNADALKNWAKGAKKSQEDADKAPKDCNKNLNSQLNPLRNEFHEANKPAISKACRVICHTGTLTECSRSPHCRREGKGRERKSICPVERFTDNRKRPPAVRRN